MQPRRIKISGVDTLIAFTRPIMCFHKALLRTIWAKKKERKETAAKKAISTSAYPS